MEKKHVEKGGLKAVTKKKTMKAVKIYESMWSFKQGERGET